MRGRQLKVQARTEARKLGALVADEVRFIRTWMEKPLTTGAVSPSGRALARAMAARIDPTWNGTVVELGPGTGAVTAALLERGVPPARLAAVEFNPSFADHLQKRFPGVTVIEGDAYALRRTVELRGIGPVAAVISSLPLFTRPPLQRHDLVSQAMDMLEPGRPFVQFSYAMVPPVPAETGRWTLDVSDWILKNLPPARVWTYRKAVPES